MERYLTLTRANATRAQVHARPFDRLFQTGSITKALHSSGFTVLLVLLRTENLYRAPLEKKRLPPKHRPCPNGLHINSTIILRIAVLRIAYQLTLKVPGLRQHVRVNHVQVMKLLDSTLHTMSMDEQLQALIRVVDAFRNLSPLPERSYLVIIDGLDECHDKATQQLLLHHLCETIQVHQSPPGLN
jgi:hypothetical protein